MKSRSNYERRVWSVKSGRAITHGTASAYPKHGCGCDICWEAYINSPGYKRCLEFSKQVTAAGGSR